MATYGRKGGEGATRGRKAELVRDPTSGLTKRVFFGQRWGLVQQQDQDAKPLFRVFHTQAEAQKLLDDWHRYCVSRGEDPPMVEYVVECEVVK